jgi:hypothetical protein
VRSEQQERWVRTDRRFSTDELARAQAAAQVALTGKVHDIEPPVFVNYYPKEAP